MFRSWDTDNILLRHRSVQRMQIQWQRARNRESSRKHRVWWKATGSNTGTVHIVCRHCRSDTGMSHIRSEKQCMLLPGLHGFCIRKFRLFPDRQWKTIRRNRDTVQEQKLPSEVPLSEAVSVPVSEAVSVSRLLSSPSVLRSFFLSEAVSVLRSLSGPRFLFSFLSEFLTVSQWQVLFPQVFCGSLIKPSYSQASIVIWCILFFSWYSFPS